MIGGYSIALTAFALLPVAEFAPPTIQSAWLGAAVVVRGLGFALYWVNARPFLMGATESVERDHVYAVQSALFPLTGFVGSLVAGLLPGAFSRLLHVSLDQPAPYRFPLWAVAGLLVPGVLALYSMSEFDAGLQNTTVERSGTAERRNRIPFWPILVLAACIFMQAASQGATMAFFNVYLDDRLGVATSTIGAMSGISQLLSSMAALSTPLLARRWGNRRIFAWGSLGVGLAMLPLALVPHWTAAGMSLLGVVAFNGMAFPAINVYQMQLVSVGWRTTMSGSTAMASGLSWSATSFFGGLAIERWGYKPFFLVSGAVTVCSAVLFGLYFRAQGRSTSDSAEDRRDGPVS
jgi:MFS family permease